MPTERHSPEKFLREIYDQEEKEKRGKLKIYFGFAPGVGKTYTMLQDAIMRRSQGVDVIVGVVESHGRKEIESLLSQLDVIPKISVNYHDHIIPEFDLNASIKRKPAVILIDEMAHTNAPGSRHAKRWQDIKEILDHGIDVCTTLNVQHVESINDDVEKIIGVKVRETVSDSMIELADSIELVDLPAEDLLKRLREGKVYFPKQAELAAENFFRRDKLTALRELALRITAERVSAQALSYRIAEKTKSIWPTREKILVCVGSDEQSIKLIRTAKRIANSLHADWIALHIDAAKLKLSTEDRKKAIQNLHMAEQLGAETRILTGLDVVKEIMQYAREQNVTQIVIGKRIRSRWVSYFSKNLADEIVRQSGDIDVYVVTNSNQEKTIRKRSQDSFKKTPWLIYLVATLIVSTATLIDFILLPYLASSNLIMVYLLGITIVALFGRVGPSIFASVLSVFAYNAVFVLPYHFNPSDIQYIFTLIVMLLVGQIISNLTILTRRQAQSSYLSEYQTHLLHNLSRQLASTRGADKILEISVKYIGEMFHCEVSALRPENARLTVSARFQMQQNLSDKEFGVAQWVYEMGQKAGIGTDTLTFSEALYLPLISSKGSIGVLRIKPAQSDVFDPEQIRLLESCAYQIALALDADRIEQYDRKSELRAAIDQVQNQLLQDISHDLKAPLIAAMGTLSMVIENQDASREIQTSCRESYVELEKLNRLIDNLLQITYLEKTIKLQKTLTPLLKLVNAATDSLRDELATHSLDIQIPDDLPDVPVDTALMIDVLKNLLENAAKFSEPKTTIYVFAIQKGNKIVVGIKDQGPGITNDEKNKLFEKFYRGREIKTERGLGLGLAICERIIKAHGGEIWAENNMAGGGAIFSFSILL